MGLLIFIGIVVLIMSVIKVPAKTYRNRTKESTDYYRGFPKSSPQYRILKRQERDRNSNKF